MSKIDECLGAALGAGSYAFGHWIGRGDDMFHTLSRSLGGLAQPTNALICCVGFGLVMALLRRTRSIGRNIVVTSAAALALCASLPLGDIMLQGLEEKFPHFEPTNRPIRGIIVLGGSLGRADNDVSRAKPGEAVDRLFETDRLAHAYPQARVLVTGGPIDARSQTSEADDVARYLVALGVARSRIIEERESRDTFENARFSRRMIEPDPNQQWILVTSAFHMARAIATFRTQGFNIIPAPADFRADIAGWPLGSSASANLQKLDVAAKEYEGILAYRLSGRIKAADLSPSR